MLIRYFREGLGGYKNLKEILHICYVSHIHIYILPPPTVYVILFRAKGASILQPFFPLKKVNLEFYKKYSYAEENNS